MLAITFSTGQFSRPCRICATTFVGLGSLCPTHLSQHARTRAVELKSARTHSAQILTAREIANRKPRTEIPDELDLMGVTA